ncbi:hypothetical protein IM660_03030 [Ruania alkalisoli]|uniref:Uncharacterized protein n=1 Tax=Ruania alkalisoli TaxID=2779775 RepID=A0A7M1SXD4_9MICO|nr:hypothetical protein [Ruania alkalisoli]QOR71293.1 hypothetical protein IM660_03030 [Ruania alkalisoli]
MTALQQGSTWFLDVVDDLQIPGWFYVPGNMSSSEQREWLAACLEALPTAIGTRGYDGNEIGPDDVLPSLREALEIRSTSPSHGIFQVWPTRGPGSVFCHVTILDTAVAPRWSELDAVCHSIDAPHIGPGLQCSIEGVVERDGTRMDTASVHLVFDDGETTLMLSINESFAPLVAYALPGLVALMESVRMVDAGGRQFRSIAPSGLLEEAPWNVEDDQ